ncbi:MAG: N-acetylmuramoyl-L-alanine amidase [Clostridia bacterium]|nr:N-acetylmuramoyl-L-alanine amidase [Clostridia bacterium]
MIVVSKKNIIISIVLIITFLTMLFSVSALSNNPIEDTDSNVITIVLDAGHGGVDGGVLGASTGVKESDLNLIVVKKLNTLLQSSGFNVVLTRSTEAGLYGVATSNLKKKDMQKRKEIILKAQPALVVSVHMNKYALSTRRGAQVFYRKDSEKSKLLANCVQNSFNNMEEASRECSALSGDYYILNCTSFPSIIAECGFLSNIEDEKLLVTDKYQDKIAYALFKGIVNYLIENVFQF